MAQLEYKIDIDKKILDLMDKKEIKFWLSVGLYLSEKISLAKAAKLANMTRFEFETRLSELNIPISLLTKEDIDKELEFLKDL